MGLQQQRSRNSIYPIFQYQQCYQLINMFNCKHVHVSRFRLYLSVYYSVWLIGSLSLSLWLATRASQSQGGMDSR